MKKRELTINQRIRLNKILFKIQQAKQCQPK